MEPVLRSADVMVIPLKEGSGTRLKALEAFAAGGGFKIIELNGVTSEATHIYDPRHSLIGAWRTLYRQWRLAFEIGRANRDDGHPPAGLFEIVRLLKAYAASSRTHPG